MLDGLPAVGEYSVLGLSVALNVFVVICLLRGILATRPQLDAVQKIADSWQKAYTDVMASQKDNSAVMTELSVLTETFKHFLESLPRAEDKD